MEAFMQTGTFYIASSSQNIPEVRQLAGDLEDRGMRWVNNYSWATDIINLQQLEKDAEKDPYILPGLAARDIAGAVGCSVFVAVLSGTESKGTYCEIGARLGVNREAHIVLNGHERYFFYHHPCVVLHRNWRDFMLAMFPHEGYIPSRGD
jgi:hypothetical protein